MPFIPSLNTCHTPISFMMKMKQKQSLTMHFALFQSDTVKTTGLAGSLPDNGYFVTSLKPSEAKS